MQESQTAYLYDTQHKWTKINSQKVISKPDANLELLNAVMKHTVADTVELENSAEAYFVRTKGLHQFATK